VSGSRLRDKNGCQVQAPPLAANEDFHLFLSHTWATGQDQMRITKQLLVERIPGLQIFLDVDDLKTGRGGEYVMHSEMVLIFVSAGYFQSVNCMRELLCALFMGKPLVTVLEPEVKNGGLSKEQVLGHLREADGMYCDRWGDANLSEEIDTWLDGSSAMLLEEISNTPHTSCADPGLNECSADQDLSFTAAQRRKARGRDLCKALILGKPIADALYGVLFENEYLEWNRLRDFQLITIRLLAQRVLGKELKEEVEIEVVKLSKLQQPMKFHIYASENNPGALELLQEMADDVNQPYKIIPPSTDIGWHRLTTPDTSAHVDSTLAEVPPCDSPATTCPARADRVCALLRPLRVPKSQDTDTASTARTPRRISRSKYSKSVTFRADAEPSATGREETSASRSRCSSVSGGSVFGRPRRLSVSGDCVRARSRGPALRITQTRADLRYASHMLVYLTEQTWQSGEMSEKFAQEVADAMAMDVSLILAHEMPGVDSAPRHACEFKFFFACEEGTTPSTLVKAGIYQKIAIALKGGEWRKASIQMLMNAVAASPAARKSKLGRLASHTLDAALTAYAVAATATDSGRATVLKRMPSSPLCKQKSLRNRICRRNTGTVTAVAGSGLSFPSVSASADDDVIVASRVDDEGEAPSNPSDVVLDAVAHTHAEGVMDDCNGGVTSSVGARLDECGLREEATRPGCCQVLEGAGGESPSDRGRMRSASSGEDIEKASRAESHNAARAGQATAPERGIPSSTKSRRKPPPGLPPTAQSLFRHSGSSKWV